MKRIFSKRLLIYMLVALAVTVTFIFCLQTVIARRNNAASSVEKLTTVKEKIASNDEEIAKLTNSLGENNLAKSRAFAEILAADPGILNRADGLESICERLMVKELHVIDAQGIITHSTVPAYIGFDMNSGEQSAAFMVMIDDPSIEIVQEPQENAAEGIVIQYVGVARKDAVGFVQVGIRPEILEETLANTEIDTVLKDFDYGTNGYVFAVEKASGLVVSHPNTELIGTDAASANIPSAIGKGKCKIDGVSGYYQTDETEELILGTFLPSSEYYATRRNQTIVVSVSMFLIFLALLKLINMLVDAQIVKGISNIGSMMSKIAEGDFTVQVEEKGNPEFAELSANINTMVSGIRESMAENEELLVKQETDMESTKALIENVKEVCTELDDVTKSTLSSADDIFNGTEEQKKSVDELAAVMKKLVEELEKSANSSAGITDTMGNAAQIIFQTQKQLQELSGAIDEISEMSQKIETIIDEINSISAQTNLLALNASIEAARAGEAGKGFAVVATEVRMLAERSSQAAHETTELITNSIKAIGVGKSITEKTVQSYNGVVDNINKADGEVKTIVEMVSGNVSIVDEAVAEIEKIEGVVSANVGISKNSQEISEQMADISGKLLDLVGR